MVLQVSRLRSVSGTEPPNYTTVLITVTLWAVAQLVGIVWFASALNARVDTLSIEVNKINKYIEGATNKSSAIDIKVARLELTIDNISERMKETNERVRETNTILSEILVTVKKPIGQRMESE